jgi:hypothetical protein
LFQHVGHLRGAGDRHDEGALRQQPGKRDLAGRGRLAPAPDPGELDQAEIAGKVVRREPRLDPADVAFGEACLGVDGAGQEADAERAPRHEADAEFLADPEHLRLRSAPEHGILALDGRDGQLGMRPAQRLEPHLAKAPVQHLALGLEVLDRTRHVLDRHGGIDSVLVEEVDTIGAKALQHALHRRLDVVGPADEAGAARAGFQIDVPAELRGDHDLVAERLDRLAEDALHLVRSVGLRRVEEGDAPLEGHADDVVHLRARRHRPLVGAAHVLHPEADGRDLQRAEHPARRHDR